MGIPDAFPRWMPGAHEFFREMRNQSVGVPVGMFMAQFLCDECGAVRNALRNRRMAGSISEHHVQTQVGFKQSFLDFDMAVAQLDVQRRNVQLRVFWVNGGLLLRNQRFCALYGGIVDGFSAHVNGESHHGVGGFHCGARRDNSAANGLTCLTLGAHSMTPTEGDSPSQ